MISNVFYLYIGLATILVSSIAIWFISRHITKPLQQLSDLSMEMANLNFEAVSALCADQEYKTRVQFQASSKQPVLQLKLASGVDSLKQSKVFISHYRNCCGLQ